MRWISSTASFVSQSGNSINGMSRPGTVPLHSSSVQSLYARMHARPSSLSECSENSCPQKRGNDGKHIDASTWLSSIAATRALGS